MLFRMIVTLSVIAFALMLMISVVRDAGWFGSRRPSAATTEQPR